MHDDSKYVANFWTQEQHLRPLLSSTQPQRQQYYSNNNNIFDYFLQHSIVPIDSRDAHG